MKIPSNRVSLKTVVYIPYRALDLPAGEHKDLKLQVQVQLPKTYANDENHKLALSLDRVAIPPTGTAANPEITTLPVAEAYLINGYSGCCVPKRVKYVLDSAKGADTEEYGFNFKGLGIKTIVGNWDDLYTGSKRLTIGRDDEFRRQMRNKLREGNPNVPVILIGHSFGADSLLKVAQCEAGNNDACPPNQIFSVPVKNRKVLFLGIIDGVESGGKRTRRTVPNNVTYLFNRWTDEPERLGAAAGGAAAGSVFGPGGTLVGGVVGGAVGIPINHDSSGELKCEAQQCQDQDKQGISREWNGEPKTTSCEWYEDCPGKSILRRSNGRKQVRVDHANLPGDDRVEYQILEALTKLLENQPAPTQPTTGGQNLTGDPTQPSNPLRVRDINLTVNLREDTCSPDCSVRSGGLFNVLVDLPTSSIRQSYIVPPGDELAESLSWKIPTQYFGASTPEKETFIVPRQRRKHVVGQFTVKTKRSGNATGTVSVTVK